MSRFNLQFFSCLEVEECCPNALPQNLQDDALILLWTVLMCTLTYSGLAKHLKQVGQLICRSLNSEIYVIHQILFSLSSKYDFFPPDTSFSWFRKFKFLRQLYNVCLQVLFFDNWWNLHGLIFQRWFWILKLVKAQTMSMDTDVKIP